VEVVDPATGVDPHAGGVLKNVEDPDLGIPGGVLVPPPLRVFRINSVAPMSRIQALPSVSVNMIRLASSGWSARAIRSPSALYHPSM
jgi:hypothetical protein